MKKIVSAAAAAAVLSPGMAAAHHGSSADIAVGLGAAAIVVAAIGALLFVRVRAARKLRDDRG